MRAYPQPGGQVGRLEEWLRELIHEQGGGTNWPSCGITASCYKKIYPCHGFRLRDWLGYDVRVQRFCGPTRLSFGIQRYD